jgi:mersacidin/lichenicidin family type 2 lantibiotic
MSPERIVRAWKDSGSEAVLGSQAGAVPAHPIGRIEIDDRALDVSGGSVQQTRTEYGETLMCCQGVTQAGKCDLTAVAILYCTTGCYTIIMSAAWICG